MSGQELRSILLSLQAGAVSRRDLAELIRFCSESAKRHIYAHFNSYLQLSLSSGYTLDDLARTSVSALFSRSAPNHFPKIDEIIASLPAALDQTDPNQLLVQFQGRVIGHARTELTSLFKTIDPEGAKIARNIKEQVKRGDQLRLSTRFRVLFIEPKREDVLAHLQAMPIGKIESELRSRASQQFSVPDFLRELHGIFVEESEHRRSIEFFDLVRFVRNFYAAGHDSENSFELDVSRLRQEELGALHTKVMKRISTKIRLDYCDEDKISIEEGRKLSLAVDEILRSIWAGEDGKQSVAKVTQRRLNVTADEYRQRWQTYAEYFVKLAKEEMRILLRDDL
ncbi:MAG TPA: hypothetical protein VMG34_13125 [Bacteroidota bacterium]|nr:hypothetical protein [Bacteroidota bacterium]